MTAQPLSQGWASIHLVPFAAVGCHGDQRNRRHTPRPECFGPRRPTGEDVESRIIVMPLEADAKASNPSTLCACCEAELLH